MQMNSDSSPQQPKNQRRKRKDPQSRDFSCLCGKKYLSYAAAFTHVKNKHKGDKQYLDGIGKPEKPKLKRGRPKQKKEYPVTLESQKLSIIQEAILQIFESLKSQLQQENPKIILEGNQQFSQTQVNNSYQSIVLSKGSPGIQFIQISNKSKSVIRQKFQIFLFHLIRHFYNPISGKIVWTLNYFLNQASNLQENEKVNQEFYIDIDILKQNVKSYSSLIHLWQQNVDIPTIIIETIEKWLTCEMKYTQINQENPQIDLQNGY